MVAFPPAKGFHVETHVIAGHKVATVTSPYFTASVSTKGVAADVEFPDLAEIGTKAASKLLDKLRKAR